VHGLDTVHRPPPDWLIADSYEERRVGLLKSGKEAEVFLVERSTDDGRSCLLAHKRYRPRHPRKGELRELGFSKGTTYRSDKVYRQGWFLPTRDRRAVETGTRHGQEVRAALWPINELTMLRRAWDAGAAVPYPLDLVDDGVLMEYIGDRSEAAPRLVNARLDRSGLERAWRELVESLRRMAWAHIVHADLSVYNLLWWAGGLVVIDFPQAVDATTNPAAPDLLHRDITNAGTWFAKRGVAVDMEATYATIVAELF
jgi:RIO kinase 1